MFRFLLPIYFIGLLFAPSSPGVAVVHDAPFEQEVHQPLPLAGGKAANDVRSLWLDAQGKIWAATGAGLYHFDPSTRSWHPYALSSLQGPAYALAGATDGSIWAGAWDGLYHLTAAGPDKQAGIDEPVSAILILQDTVMAFTPTGMWKICQGKAEKSRLAIARSVHRVKPDLMGGYYVATERGLFHQHIKVLRIFQNEKDLLSAYVTDVELAADGRLWVGGMGGITLYQGDQRVGQYTPAEGLASIYVQCLRKAPDGRMWIGTRNGLIRQNGASWQVRHSQRWLCGDDVRDILFDRSGAAWLATDAGVSVLTGKPMTLAEKAVHFHRILEARHIRPPYLVEKCRLTTPGDTLTGVPLDCDNDGQYTSMYLAMESFRFAVTKSPQAANHARKAFAALQLLQTITDTKGFVARSVVPSDWTKMADRNRTLTEQEWAEQRVANPREKRVEKMWRLSRDAKWLWKGDTSSDEITGHMYGYLYYYDLVADASEKKRVKEHVCHIVDGIIQNEFMLIDIDGKPTQWGVWSPQRLNHDPDWATERGINSVELLSFIKLAYHMSGEERYQKVYIDLLQKHDYAGNILFAKTSNPSWITHIDDELLALAYPCLLLHESDPHWLALYQKSIQQWYETAEKDASPFFNFTYAGLTGQDPRLEASLFFLRDVPLDLIRWRVDNSHRTDVRLRYFPEMENLQTDRLLPPSEISFCRWDDNPWYPVQGDGGATESDGVFWLLPYWMGRYYGFIR